MRNLFLFILVLTVSLQAQNQTLFYEDFEDGLDGWTAFNLSDPSSPTLWRVTNTRFVSPSHSAAWNDSVTNTYPDERYEALESPDITIPYNTRTFLKFKAFIHLTLNGTYYHDYFHIKYTTNNGTTWNNFLPYANSGQQLVWRSFPEDFGPTAYNELTYYAGKTMRFRIITRSDTLNPNGLGVFLDDFHVYSQQCEFPDPNEPNNSLANATEVNLGDILHVSLCPQNDEDIYKFTAQQGDELNIATQHSISYTYLYLMNSNGITLKNAYNEMTYSITQSGTYYLRVTGSYNYGARYSIYFNSRPKPDILSVTDIPGDQGLKVRVKWMASFYDPQSVSGKIKEYQLWRKVQSEDTLAAWEYIATVPALSGRPFVNYSYVAPTPEDNVLFTFRVAAIPKSETLPVEWGTEGSGSSADNISPDLNNTSAVITSDGIKISWSINSQTHPDAERLQIFKGVYEIFPPLNEYKIAELIPSSSTYVDNELLSGYNYYYIVAVTDKAGNISYSEPFSAGVITTADEEIFLPGEISLKQNYPNPFNPVTVIEFSIPSVTELSLRVYDVLGKQVKELAGGNYTPGVYRINFDASDLPSGIYFYTLAADRFRETKKLVLLK